MFASFNAVDVIDKWCSVRMFFMRDNQRFSRGFDVVAIGAFVSFGIRVNHLVVAAIVGIKVTEFDVNRDFAEVVEKANYFKLAVDNDFKFPILTFLV